MELVSPIPSKEETQDSLVGASKSSALIENYERINMQVHRARHRNNLKRTVWDQSIGEHEKTITALQTRDGNVLPTILRRRMDSDLYAVMEVANELKECRDAACET